MQWGFIETYDKKTGHGTITPCASRGPIPFEVAPGTELIANTEKKNEAGAVISGAPGERVTYDIGDRAVNVKRDPMDISAAYITVDSFGARL